MADSQFADLVTVEESHQQVTIVIDKHGVGERLASAVLEFITTFAEGEVND